MARVSRPTRYPVLLHGFTGSAATWGEPLVDGLTGAGLTPVLVDLPGHGREAERSDPAAFTLEAVLGHVVRAGDWPADVVGYSMGGRIALHFAAAFPERVRRLVLESASPGLAAEAERVARRASDEALAAQLLSGGIEPFVDAWEAQPLFESRAGVDASVRAHQRQLRLRNDPAGLAAALRGFGTGALPSLWERLAEIAVPTLLVVGALDPKFVEIARRMARAMPDARVLEVAGAGHTVHLERPDAWLAAVAEFLQG
jgi:2-succinyl-6-hydroxy-2,4-cyclohexadiene-1-carboxylate synthase